MYAKPTQPLNAEHCAQHDAVSVAELCCMFSPWLFSPGEIVQARGGGGPTMEPEMTAGSGFGVDEMLLFR